MAIILMSFDKMAVYINIYYLSVNYYIWWVISIYKLYKTRK
jgi:hypothetical protein